MFGMSASYTAVLSIPNIVKHRLHVCCLGWADLSSCTREAGSCWLPVCGPGRRGTTTLTSTPAPAISWWGNIIIILIMIIIIIIITIITKSVFPLSSGLSTVTSCREAV